MTADGRAILEGVLLDPDQEQLLGTLVEGARQAADRSERVFELYLLQGSTVASGPGLGQDGLRVEKADIELFEREGLVLVLSRGKNLWRFRVTPEGEARYEGARSPAVPGQDGGDSGYSAWSERRRSS